MPGWPLRNFLALLTVHCSNKVDKLTVICYRPKTKGLVIDISNSIVLSAISLPKIQNISDINESKISFVGWERNSKGNLSHKVLNLSATHDPIK